MNSTHTTTITPEQIDEAIQRAYGLGQVNGYLEGYDHFLQAQEISPGQREQELAHLCRTMRAGIEKLVRVNRYLFRLISPHEKANSSIAKAVAVFTHIRNEQKTQGKRKRKS